MKCTKCHAFVSLFVNTMFQSYVVGRVHAGQVGSRQEDCPASSQCWRSSKSCSTTGNRSSRVSIPKCNILVENSVTIVVVYTVSYQIRLIVLGFFFFMSLILLC